jgi:hypothetical protein
MFDLALITDQLKAKPFEPFALTLVNGERCKVLTKEHIAIPPLDEGGRAQKWIVLFNARTGRARYLDLGNIAAIDHDV